MNLPPSSSFLESVPLLLCEGDSDERLLDRIFNTRELKAQQVGGARNIRPAAAYLTRQNQPVFTIQDRDFRPLSEAEECYSQNYADRHFMWRRHELENYLIEPRVVANCFKQLQPYSKVTLPETENSARHWIKELARDLLEDQAGRQTAWELRRQLHDTFPTTSSISQENAIQSREEWQNRLINEMEEIRSQARQFEEFVQTTDADILQNYEAKLQIFSEPSFLNTDRHLRDFGGHEMVQMIYQEARINIRRYGIQEFQTDLVESFVEEWNRDSSFLQPNDFDDLSAAIRRLTGASSRTN